MLLPGELEGATWFMGLQHYKDPEVVKALEERDLALEARGFPQDPQYEANPDDGFARLKLDGTIEFDKASP
jgi:hypothetical protein